MTAMHSKKKPKRRANLLLIFAIFLLIAGIGVIAYPYISQWEYAREATQGYEQFLAAVEENDTTEPGASPAPSPTPGKKEKFVPLKYTELYKLIEEYNAALYKDGQFGLSDSWSYQKASFDLSAYGFDENIIGYIKIPSIEVTLPIYLGASDYNMSLGAAHLSQTSLPIGGDNTNSVICGHKGYSGKILFDRIMELKEGDEVLITNLWRTISYHVVSTTTILSDEVDKLKIQEGKDMLSLFTCYYQSSGRRDRYVVYCERTVEEAK